ncbi:MAG: NFACT RNA binding domain-containing protein [Clostridia bacterium]
MALDGIFLNFLVQEINENLADTRIEKIYQPSKDEIVLSFRGRNGAKKLYVCTNASCPRINLTQKDISNPANPPMFCMLMRKHLGGAKFAGATQLSLDRILFLNFIGRNDFGDEIKLIVAVEIMNRHSNLVLINQENKIIDCIKRVDISLSQQRQLLPAMFYTLPPQQEKINIINNPTNLLIEKLNQYTRDDYLDKALMNLIEGISPIVAREIAYFVCKGEDIFAYKLSIDMQDRLCFFIDNIKSMVKNNISKPVSLKDKNGMPKDFSFLSINQYGLEMISKQQVSCSALLDDFYSEKSDSERVKQRANDLLKLLTNTVVRLYKKIENQKTELISTKNRDEFKILGDIINANLYTINKGDCKLIADNFYTQKTIEISLDPKLTPAQNAQKYYKLYKKSVAAEEVLKQQIEKAEKEIIYLESVFDLVSRTTNFEEISEIKDELFSQGYVKRQEKKGIKKKPLKPQKYISSDGFIILSGRNNIQNDTLTLKTSKPTDIWFHTKDIPGSHTVVISENKAVSEETILQAAKIAAFNSKGKYSSQVPVDYTEIKNVKKPAGAKPGMVIYVKNKTIYVTPDETEIKKLKRE